MNVSLSQARECWSEVVERLQHGEEIVLANSRNRQAAVMRRLEGESPAGPVWSSSKARQELGALVAAAQEGAQVLTVGG
uniref:hypothetical protein n=1 Tax=Streptomyces albus TaxID=1888 RepID=UPI00131E1D9D